MTTLEIYRDDGPLVWLLRFRSGGPSVLVAALGLGVVALGVSTAELEVAVPAFLAFVGIGLWSAVAPVDRQLGWLVPPVLRVGEYGLLLWAALWGILERPALAFGYLAAIAFHHYDIVYRTRHQRVAPPTWLRLAGGGWEVRTLLLLGGVLLGRLETVVLVVAVWCALLYVSESLVSWVRVGRDEQRQVAQSLEDEEDIF